MKKFFNVFIAIIMCFMMISMMPVYAAQTEWYDDSLIFWEATEYDIIKLGYKPVNVMFYVQLDNEYKSLIPHVIRVDGDKMYGGFITVEGAKLPKVKGPYKPGYTFIGWRDLEDKEGKIWNHETDIITKNTALEMQAVIVQWIVD